MNELANETGKRYYCAKCDAEIVVTRGSDDASLTCCGSKMVIK